MMTRVVWHGLDMSDGIRGEAAQSRVERVVLRGRKRARRNRGSWYRAGKSGVHTTVGGAGETERALRRRK